MRLRPALWAQGFGILVGNLVRNPCAAPLCGDLVQSLVPATLRAKFSESQSDRYKKRLLQCLVRALCGPCASLFLPFVLFRRLAFSLLRLLLCNLVRDHVLHKVAFESMGPCAENVFPDVPLQKNPYAPLCASYVLQTVPCAPCARFFRCVLFSVKHSRI